MATPSMRHIFLQAFQRVLKSFFPFLGLGSRWPRQVNPLSVFKCENNAKNARMKRSTGGMETGASAIGRVRHFHLCFKLVIYLMDVRIAPSPALFRHLISAVSVCSAVSVWEIQLNTHISRSEKRAAA